MEPESNDFSSFVDDCHHRKQKIMKKTVCVIHYSIVNVMGLGMRKVGY